MAATAGKGGRPVSARPTSKGGSSRAASPSAHSSSSVSKKSGLRNAMDSLKSSDPHGKGHRVNTSSSGGGARGSGTGSSSSYAFTQPCLEEEAEAAAEKRKNREALERLKQKLKEERERDGDPSLAAPEQDDGFLRAIFDRQYERDQYASNGGYNGAGPGGSGEGATSTHEERTAASKKVAARIIPRVQSFASQTSIETGCVVFKHGRTGAPKKRFVIYDAGSQQVRWKSEQEKNMSAMSKMFAGGTERCTDPTAMAEGLRIADIVKVVKGVHTDVMLRAKLVDPSTCISIVTGDRTLDLTLESHRERNALYTSIRQVLDRELPEHSVLFA